MKKCPFCAEQIEDDAQKCSYCNSNLNEPGIIKAHEKGDHKNSLKWIAIIIGAIILIGFAGYRINIWRKEQAIIEEARREELAKRERENRFNNAINSNNPDLICSELDSDAGDACAALVAIAGRGRSTNEERSSIRDFLKQRGYSKLSGYVVGLIEDGVYECAYLEYNYYYGYMPTSSHFVLKTALTEYSTTGRFTIWAKRNQGRETYSTSGGGQRDVAVYEEDALGTAVEAIFSAPAGFATKQAANVVLRAMLGMPIPNE